MGTIWRPSPDFTSGPKYKAVLEALRVDIAENTLAVGDRLPPVRDLAWQLEVTPGTIARAYQLGVSEGILEAAVGRGTFVATQKTTEDFRPIMFEVEEGGLINLRNTSTTNVGQSTELRAAMIRAAEQASGYMDYPERKARHDIYRHLCDWMQYSHVQAKPENIVLTNGGQNAINIACSAILTEGSGPIALDALTYPGIRYALQAHNAAISGVLTDEHGIIPEDLIRVCKRDRPRALFTSVNVLNPTTGEMPYQRRVEIAEIARDYDLQIIEDDCWGIGEARTPGFSRLCPERAWYLSSFSKVVAAGLRFGYLLCPEGMRHRASRIVQTNSFGTSRAVIDIAHELLASGDAQAIRNRILSRVSERVETTVNMLGHHDISWRKDVPFIWVPLTRGWRGSSFASACERRKIAVRAADEFALNNMPIPNAVRISVNCNIPLDQYQEALREIDTLLLKPRIDVES
ncbi:GntR family transcriptional regulator [Amylibacter marinus]|uniref:GntR family transcriptional regulator n=1 Tax=Amylibacter marinus TaxID=1475483 RepID=A0ABQ5VUE6_9RHOB|nr:PLP-dependent aminotransferase family protein [Amylibacter marinus]GLQ34950.1 GntR family transcriptional regulator [Amylibacter marinus]